MQNHLSISLPLLASEVHEGGDLVHSAVGESNRVNHMGSGQWSVVDKGGGGVVDDRGNVMEDRVGNHLMAHLFKWEMRNVISTLVGFKI